MVEAHLRIFRLVLAAIKEVWVIRPDCVSHRRPRYSTELSFSATWCSSAENLSWAQLESQWPRLKLLLPYMDGP